jgi:hypothetical protein
VIRNICSRCRRPTGMLGSRATRSRSSRRTRAASPAG